MPSDPSGYLRRDEARKDLRHHTDIGEVRPQVAIAGDLRVSGGRMASAFGGVGRPSIAESARRRREFLRLVVEGVPGDEAARRARIKPERALAILTHPDVRPLLAAAA